VLARGIRAALLNRENYRNGQAKDWKPLEWLTKAGFPNPPHASEPDDGSLLPRAFEQFQPEFSVYYTKLYLHIVALNATALAVK
jgi:hypothetical protein